MADQILQASVKYRANPDFLMREIGGEYVLVPVGQAGLFENSMLSLNATCGYLWKMFQMPCTIDQAVEKAQADFDGPADEIERDVRLFVREYLKYKLLVEEKDND